ncbi:MAG TPA: ABC transporter ATP-binding protein [Spirochaetales bacterium]|jgi:simple sugar transport system ATP-binding protein|nr:ABC transporter ATP-binding protein [Spirochaetales bacterium]
MLLELAVEMLNITKTYPENNLRANDGVDFVLRKGEILCLAGENGAGKTTLMKVLYGLEDHEEGTIKIRGNQENISSPMVANRLGIGMVHQHFMLVEDFTVAQNVLMGIEPRKHRISYDLKKAVTLVNEVIERHHFSIEADMVVRNLTVGQKQQVEIIKMLYRDVDILILDEPTSVLTEQEIESLFSTFRQLAKRGKSLILITHKLREIKAISDRVSVMRNGKMLGTYETDEVDERQISALMMGKSISFFIEHTKKDDESRPVIEGRKITVLRQGQERPLLNGLSFTAYSKEILGFAGVSGNGLGVLEAVLGGFIPTFDGKVLHNGKDITNIGTALLRKQGLAYVPSDRLHIGSSLKATVQENIIVGESGSFKKNGFLDQKRVTKHTNDLLQRYSAKATAQMPIGTLSGGNIQKVILAREIERYRDYIVFSEPTWGLDVASSQFVYEQIASLRDKGAAVILISSNLDEMLTIADRIIILYRGTRVASFSGDEARALSKEEIGEYMLGIRNQGDRGA